MPSGYPVQQVLRFVLSAADTTENAAPDALSADMDGFRVVGIRLKRTSISGATSLRLRAYDDAVNTGTRIIDFDFTTTSDPVFPANDNDTEYLPLDPAATGVAGSKLYPTVDVAGGTFTGWADFIIEPLDVLPMYTSSAAD